MVSDNSHSTNFFISSTKTNQIEAERTCHKH